MAETVNISTVLKRNLKGGKEFDILMPRVRCNTTPLGDGDTFFTVDRMKEWIEKFRHQTAKIALRLEGRTVEETVNNIYNFLYNHIQYTADGSLQQLRSPACTWMQRKEGVDCKSYSVFASSLLSNLGIKHAVRQVRQTYFYPEEFTHVYVVIFKDQSKEHYDSTAPTFVLDATKHENTEVNYLEKVDLYMNKLSHVGLNAPQDERAANISKNFERFCAFLLSKGASVSEVNNIRSGVSQYTRKGVDPKINIVSDGLTIQGVDYPVELTEYVSFPEVKQAFYGNNKGLNGVGLGFSFGDVFSKIGDFTKKTGASNSGGGGSIGNIFGGGDSQPTQPGGAGVGNMIDSIGRNFPFGDLIGGFLENFNVVDNINNAFKYGLNSWGAATSPEQMSGNFSQKVLPYFKEKLESITLENVQDQLFEIETNMRINKAYHSWRIGESRASSSKKGHAQADSEYNKLLNTMIPELIKMFEDKGVKVQKSVWSGNARSLKVPYLADQGQTFTTSLEKLINARLIPTLFKYNFDFSGYKGGYQSPDDTKQNVGGGSNYQPTGSGQQNGSGTGKKEKSSNTGIIVAGVGLAALPFLLPMMKSSPVPVAKKPAARKSAAKKPAKKTTK